MRKAPRQRNHLRLVVDNRSNCSSVSGRPSRRARRSSLGKWTAGTLLRACHFMRVWYGKPSASAKVNTVFQSGAGSSAKTVIPYSVDIVSTLSRALMAFTSCGLREALCVGQLKAMAIKRLSEIQSRLRLAREEAGYSLDSMADRLGILKSTYHKWETRAGSSIQAEYVELFCLTTNTAFEWLFTGKGQRYRVIPRRA